MHGFTIGLPQEGEDPFEDGKSKVEAAHAKISSFSHTVAAAMGLLTRTQTAAVDGFGGSFTQGAMNYNLVRNKEEKQPKAWEHEAEAAKRTDFSGNKIGKKGQFLIPRPLT